MMMLVCKRHAVRGFHLSKCCDRRISVLRDCVVTVESWSDRYPGQGTPIKQASVSFYKRSSNSDGYTREVCPIPNCDEMYKPLTLSEDHVGVVYTIRDPANRRVENPRYPTRMHWYILQLAVYHVHTCKNVLVYPLLDPCFGNNGEVPNISYSEGTIAMTLEDEGIAISSHTHYST
jgi:hypothetical protein